MLNSRSIALQGIGYTALAVAVAGFVVDQIPPPAAGGGGSSAQAQRVGKKKFLAPQLKKSTWQTVKEQEREKLDRLLRGEPDTQPPAVVVVAKPTIVDVVAQPKQKFNLGETLYGGTALSAVTVVLPTTTPPSLTLVAAAPPVKNLPKVSYADAILKKSLSVRKEIARKVEEEQELQMALVLAVYLMDET